MKHFLVKLPRAYIAYGLLALSYTLLELLLPANSAARHTYHLTSGDYRLLILTVTIPVTLIWFAAFRGYHRLFEYTRYLKKSREGQHFRQIAIGFQWLAWGLPITTILSVILQSFAQRAGWFITPATIMSNYASLIVSVGAFLYLSRGARNLNTVIRKRPTLLSWHGMFLVFALLAVVYTYVVFTGFHLRFSAVNDPYHLPHAVVIFTLVLPYLYAWFLGVWSALEVAVYGRYVRGIFYRKSLNLLALGIGSVILSSIFIQFLTSLAPALANFDLPSLLLFVYILLVVYGLGYLLVALGADRLKRLEEV